MSLKDRARTAYAEEGNEAKLSVTPPLPTILMLEVTNACNHACGFCPSAHMRRTKGLMAPELARAIIGQAAEAGISEIGFYTTGEPLLHKHLPDLCAHAKACGIAYTYVSTNGVLATPERMERLFAAGLDSIKFSINAGSRETYLKVHGSDDFDAVVANVRWLSERRSQGFPQVKLYVTCTVTAAMRHEIAEVERLFASLVDELSFYPASPYASPDLGEDGGSKHCMLPFNRLHVSCEGLLTACCVDYENYLAVADLKQVSLTEAWLSPTFQDLRRRHLEDKLLGTACGWCWAKDPSPVKALMPDVVGEIDYNRYLDMQRASFRALDPAGDPS